MHIKGLEICGFKSFVDRTVIHFDHDVIGIVGPNGCGKSNIVDAIRWCLGEQSARHLRGRAMEDVIFNGSESRGPHGFAEATLTFDNSDPEQAAELPEEYKHYPEIAVTRRLFRDGTSEYLINRVQVRLRDVTDLFLGTGVGTKAYSIIEQGRIGQIVSARPEDRRVFLEEAAGITKYKQRRRQAERKIELTRQNLLRVTDIVQELERSRNSLKRQVAKAERYIEYRSELTDLVLYDASHRHLEYLVMSRVEGERFATHSAQAAELRVKVDELEDGLEEQRTAAMNVELAADEAARAAFDADNQVTSIHTETQRARDRMSVLVEKLDAIQSEQEELEHRQLELEEERTTLDDRIGELERDWQARELDAQAEVETLEELRAGETAATISVQDHRGQVNEASNRAAALEARLDALVAQRNELLTRRERLEAERDALSDEMVGAEAQRHALAIGVAELAEGKRLSFEEKQALEQETASLRSRCLESERAVDVSKNALGVKRNRLRALDELHRKHEGVGSGTRALLSYGHPTVLGLVADRIEAPEDMQHALAGLLGDRLQSVVVRDLTVGLKLLGRLGAERRGRAHIVPARPGYVSGARPTLPAEMEGLSYLIDSLRFDPEDEGLARSLVGHAVVARSPEEALALWQERPELTVVTREGTVLRGDGLVSGGTGDEIAAHLLEQKRELRLLSEEVDRLEQAHAKILEGHNELRARLTETTSALDRARQQVHQGELAHVAAEKDLARVVDQLERLTRRRDTILRDMSDLEGRQADTAATLDSENLALDELRTDLARLNEALERADATAAEWRDRVTAQGSTVTERKVRLAQVKEQVESATSSRRRVEAALSDLLLRGHRLQEDAREAAAAYGESAARAYLGRQDAEEAGVRAQYSHEQLESARAELDCLRQKVAERDQGLRGLREQLEVSDTEARSAEMALTRMQIENDHLLRSIEERFRGLDLRRVVGDYHARPMPDPEHRRRIEELTQLIDRMGPVNLDAKTEYEDAEARHASLKTQKLDLEKALEDLERAIKMMNRESRKRFREAFDVVNELFKKTFIKNFGGGRAELVLTDPEDLLGTGVDIIAQPPGKKLGNIELMSGGEKALTATSLIFAIFQYKPSPFCILDEVDAPLDEANVSRYNEAVRSMTDRSQFILITHVRKTMQSVDVLYGVTMGEPGVSRLVSVRVNEAATRSDARSASRETLAPEPEAAATDAQVQVA